jgi:hypothetical protein
MHLPINVKTPNNISKWQMGFNSSFKWLTLLPSAKLHSVTIQKPVILILTAVKQTRQASTNEHEGKGRISFLRYSTHWETRLMHNSLHIHLHCDIIHIQHFTILEFYLIAKEIQISLTKQNRQEHFQHFWRRCRMPVGPTRPPLHNLYFNLISGENFKSKTSTFSEQYGHALQDYRTKFTISYRLI